MVESTSKSEKHARILLAEDDDQFRELLCRSLRDHGYSVTECRHGLELIDKLHCLDTPAQPEDFDLIISDVRMPGVSGLSVLAGLKHFSGVPPIIIITAFGDEETHAEAKRMGAAAIIDKPFEIADLLAAASAALVPEVISSD